MITVDSIALSIDPLHGSLLDRQLIASEVMAHLIGEVTEDDGLMVLPIAAPGRPSDDQTVCRIQVIAGVSGAFMRDPEAAAFILSKRFGTTS